VIAYVDASVVIRLALDERNALAEWARITTGICSALVEVECMRTLDRLRLTDHIRPRAVPARQEAIHRILGGLELIEISPAILRRAAQPLSTALGTLDAIHLATASAWRDDRDLDIAIATHDRALAAAARASGFAVVGAEQER
jgi:predicted nucleic acid-binding protein